MQLLDMEAATWEEMWVVSGSRGQAWPSASKKTGLQPYDDKKRLHHKPCEFGRGVYPGTLDKSPAQLTPSIWACATLRPEASGAHLDLFPAVAVTWELINECYFKLGLM